VQDYSDRVDDGQGKAHPWSDTQVLDETEILSNTLVTDADVTERKRDEEALQRVESI